MIVIATGWAMLKKPDENDRDTVGRTVGGTDILRGAFYPLTPPLTVGPGSISIAITLRANEPHHLGPNLPAIRPHRSGGNERDRKALVVPSGMHWRPNRLERREPIAFVLVEICRSDDISLDQPSVFIAASLLVSQHW